MVLGLGGIEVGCFLGLGVLEWGFWGWVVLGLEGVEVGGFRRSVFWFG